MPEDVVKLAMVTVGQIMDANAGNASGSNSPCRRTAMAALCWCHMTTAMVVGNSALTVELKLGQPDTEIRAAVAMAVVGRAMGVNAKRVLHWIKHSLR